MFILTFIKLHSIGNWLGQSGVKVGQSRRMSGLPDTAYGRPVDEVITLLANELTVRDGLLRISINESNN